MVFTESHDSFQSYDIMIYIFYKLILALSYIRPFK